MADIEEEIAQALDRAFDAWDGKESEPQFVARQIMPLVKRAQAERAAQELRELAGEYVDRAFLGWPHNVDVREAAEHFEGMTLAIAARIENEGAGA